MYPFLDLIYVNQKKYLVMYRSKRIFKFIEGNCYFIKQPLFLWIKRLI